MMTLEQIKICQRLGLDCDWILQNYSFLDGLLLNNKVEQATKQENLKEKIVDKFDAIEKKIYKQVASRYKTEASNNKAKVKAALQYNIKLYLSALVQEGLKTKDDYILWYGLWESGPLPWESEENMITQQDYKNIPNGKIEILDEIDDKYRYYDVWWNCEYFRKNGHSLIIECDKLCRPIRYSIEG